MPTILKAILCSILGYRHPCILNRIRNSVLALEFAASMPRCNFLEQRPIVNHQLADRIGVQASNQVGYGQGVAGVLAQRELRIVRWCLA